MVIFGLFLIFYIKNRIGRDWFDFVTVFALIIPAGITFFGGLLLSPIYNLIFLSYVTIILTSIGIVFIYVIFLYLKERLYEMREFILNHTKVKRN